ncbi:ATP-binding protein [Candidatus Kaiserbacteria bacterium]|nr:ATP-binding protein [Candidatus Kaiserbacteria bacterium]
MKDTNWAILTGAPNSGKSSVLDRLSFLGYRTVPESARLFINQEISAGRPYAAIRGNEQEFQKNIFALNHDVTKRFDPKELMFFDRGLGDSAAYFEIHGMVCKIL